MGDRVWVRLTVLTAQADAALKIIDDEHNGFYEIGLLTMFSFEEVNYGNLDFEDVLVDAGIAFDKRWEAGTEYTAGTKYVRFDEHGLPQVIELYDEAMNPNLDKLLSLLDKPNELVKFIKEFHTKTRPLPWDNQVEYSKRYLARKLLTD